MLPPLVAVVEPSSGDEIDATFENGAAAVQMSGVSRAVASSKDLHVVVLAKAIEPASPGWWAFEAVDPDPDGSWTAQGFIGSAQVPIEEGHRFQVVALATEQDDPENDFVQPIESLGKLDPQAYSAAVSFSISTVQGRPSVAITQPGPDANVPVAAVGDGTVRLEVLGSSDNAADAEAIVLVHPTDPFASGWWPSAPAPVDDDGRWSAEVSVGSEQIPVGSGQGFEIVVVLVASGSTPTTRVLDDPADMPSQARSDAVAFTIDVMASPDSRSSTLGPTESQDYEVLASSLKVRAAPTTTAATLDEVAKGGTVEVVCTGRGDPYKNRSDHWRTRWHRVSEPSSGWVAAAFVDTGGSNVPECQCSDPPVAIEAESAAQQRTVERRENAFGGFTVHLDNERMGLPITVCANAQCVGRDSL